MHDTTFDTTFVKNGSTWTEQESEEELSSEDLAEMLSKLPDGAEVHFSSVEPAEDEGEEDEAAGPGFLGKPGTTSSPITRRKPTRGRDPKKQPIRY